MNMDSTLSTKYKTITVTIPEVDFNMLKTLAKKLGWSIEKKSGIELAMDDIKAGRVYKSANTEELFKDILG